MSSAVDAAYLLIEPFASGRVVLDVGPRPPESTERLMRAGAVQVVAADPAEPRLSAPDASADMVLCLARLAAVTGDAERHRWLAELRRVLRPGGLCVLRGGPSATTRAELQDTLAQHFDAIELVDETPLAAVSFVVRGIEEIAVNETLASVAGEAAGLVAFCAAGARRPWQLVESLLVPLATGPDAAVAAPDEEREALRAQLAGATERYHAASAERDAVRDAHMALQDRIDRQEEALSSLRRDAERHLRQISEDAAALELAGLERDRAVDRAASAERALEAAAAELQRLRAELAAAEKELARLRRSPGQAPGRTNP